MQYSIFDSPVRVYGVPLFEKNKRLERFPAELRDKLAASPSGGYISEQIATRTVGARAAFITDSKKIRLV